MGAWTEMCFNATKSGHIDGCGADFTASEAGSVQAALKWGVSNASAHEWALGKFETIRDTTTALGDGLLVGNTQDWQHLGTNGLRSMLSESCDPTNKTVNLLRAITARAAELGQRLVYECHFKASKDCGVPGTFPSEARCQDA